MDNSENSILENTISYLYKISEVLPHNLPIPKSYYASKSRILELKGPSCLPTTLTTAKIRCPRCCLNFSNYPPNVRLLPPKPKDRFTKKLLKKIEEGKPLTSCQEKFKTILKKSSDNNTLVRTCQFCKKEVKTNIKFKENKVKKVQVEDTPTITQKKKKKKKDKFAGLTPSAVISFNESNVNSENIPIKKKSLKEILLDDKNKEGNKIKYNVIGEIVEKKNKKKKKKNIQEPPKPTKMKIMERKESKADKKQKNKIKNLLNTLDKPTASNVLSGFLQSL